MSDARWRPTRLHRGAVVCGAVFYLAMTALLVLRLDDIERDVLLVRNIGLLVVLGLPLALAIVSLLARPMLLLPAAILSLLFSPMMWSGLPLVLVPGVVYAIAFAKDRAPSSSPLQMAGAIVIPVALGITAFGMLFSNTTHTCAAEGDGSVTVIPGGASGTVGIVDTAGGSSRSVCAVVSSTASVGGAVVIVVVAVAASAYVATPRAPLPAVSPAGRSIA